MADENRSFAPDALSSNRARRQGLGGGQKEMDAQPSANREASASDPQRTAPERAPPGAALDERNAAGLDAGGELGAGTPPAVDVHDLGQRDNPQEDWGEAIDEGALHSADHSRRPVRTEAERGQGAKTRRMNKDIVSRRT